MSADGNPKRTASGREQSSGLYSRGLAERQASRWPLRLLALAIAFVTWLIVSYLPRLALQNAPPIEKEVEASVTYQPVPPLNVFNRDHVVRATVRGPEAVIEDLTSRDVDIRVPFPKPEEITLGAPTTVLLSPENVTVPSGVEVISLNPDRLVLLIDKRQSRELPVIPRTVGEPAAGARYDAEGTRVTPPVVEVVGPGSRVENLNRVVTAPIRLDNHGLSFTQTVEVLVEGENMTDIRPSLVDVCVRLKLPNQEASDPCPPR